MNKKNAKTETKGTKIAAQGREQCNNLSETERQSAAAFAMRMIYHNHSEADQPVVNRR